MTPSSRPCVLHLGKFYPPVSGGMETVLQLLCQRQRTAVDTRVLVANTGPATVREQVDGVAVTRVANRGAVGSVSICPSLPVWLRRERADLIVIHEPNPFGLLAYALARPAGRVVVWFHSEVVRHRLQYDLFYKPWFANAMRRAERVIVASPPMSGAEQLRGYESKTTVVPYGIDTSRLALTSAIAARANAMRQTANELPIVLFVGRMVPYKGADVLLHAMVDVPAKAVLIGNGPERGALETLARDLGIADRVLFAGEVETGDLIAWYHACDVFVLPSVTRAEAFGMVQIEAMACGKPVVSTNLPTGVPWVNRHGETGLVVQPADAPQLANALSTLVTDPVLCHRFGEHGRRRVAQHFTAEVMAQRALAVYHEALSETAVVRGAAPQVEQG